MHYFPSRQVAGSLLADELEAKGYRYEDCAILALNDGAVIVGAQIAMRLHCVLTMLLTSSIKLQGEIDALAEIDHTGGITFNDIYSAGELEELKSENFNYIEQQKLQKLFEMNKLLGQGGVIDRDLLRNRHIIIVSDGLLNGLSLHAVAQFLKPIRTKKIIVATPFASVHAVDQMHILADEIFCLNVLEDVFSVNHYYDDNKMPDHERIIEILEDIILHWK
ncbi:MAG TPA: phosphoribosyltransferase family protein [Candidatus Saccharimonadales bacterium]|nr:phosphoribosyltransferase family protein [Candidatus Saccharimonadales bacterium]